MFWISDDACFGMNPKKNNKTMHTNTRLLQITLMVWRQKINKCKSDLMFYLKKKKIRTTYKSLYKSYKYRCNILIPTVGTKVLEKHL